MLRGILFAVSTFVFVAGACLLYHNDGESCVCVCVFDVAWHRHRTTGARLRLACTYFLAEAFDAQPQVFAEFMYTGKTLPSGQMEQPNRYTVVSAVRSSRHTEEAPKFSFSGG